MRALVVSVAIAATALAVAIAATALGCGAKGHATVDGVLIPQADGVVDAAEGATVAADVANVEQAAVPADARVVRLALGRSVPWHNVQRLVQKVRDTGAQPVLLVGARHKVKAFELEDSWPGGDRFITVISYVDGKACVQPPGAIEAKCVQSGDKRQIDRAFLRELIREQVKVFDLPMVKVELAESLEWDDVVRTIDAARTCCYETKVAVGLKR